MYPGRQVHDSDQSLKIVVDGPPDIGETTVCCKIINFVVALLSKTYLTSNQFKRQ